MDLLNSFYSQEYQSQINKSLLDNKNYAKIEQIMKNISFPINIINDPNITKCAIMIIINSGYMIESLTLKYENYIKLILELIFEQKNNFNKLFRKYNLKYEYKIYPQKTIIYLEFDYKGLNPIFHRFIKTIINFDELLIQNNIDEILNSINIANNIDSNYLSYKKLLVKHLEQNEINDNKNFNISEFFQYFILKNNNKYITILSPYPTEKCKNIIINIFEKLKFDIKNNIIKLYEKYNPSIIKYLSSDETTVLITRKLDIEKNNVITLKFYFPELSYETKNILHYIVYMINGKRIGSLYYCLFKNNFIKDLKAYCNFDYNMPPQIIIKIKVYNSFSQFGMKIVLSKLINFFRKLKYNNNIIKATYENYQKMLLHNFNINNNNYNTEDNKDLKYYSYLYEFTNNFIFLKEHKKNEINENRYINLLLKKFLLPEYNLSLINSIIDEIMSLKNLKILMDLNPKFFSNFTYNMNRYSDLFLHKSVESNDYITYYYGIINKPQIINYAETTRQWDNSSFKHKQDKKCYIPNELNNNISNVNLSNNNTKVQIGLNTIANKLWYYITDIKNINSDIIKSKFHLIHPYIRNHSDNTKKINIKYYNYIDKKIEQEFEEIFCMGNEIKLTRDENGINLEINVFKDIYIKVLEKILSFFFYFENDFFEYADVNYTDEYFKSDLDQAIYFLGLVLKKDIKDKYFQEKNNMFYLFKLKSFGVDLEDNIHIDSFIYGNVDMDMIKKIKNLFLKYNTREYDQNNIFKNINEFKKKIFEINEIKEGHIYIYKLDRNFNQPNINYFFCFYQILEFDKDKNIFLILIYLLMKKYLISKNSEIYKIYIDKIYYILIMRKSLDYPEYMAKHTSINIKKLIEIICNKSDKILKKILLELKPQFTEEILSQKYKYDFLWSQIYNDTYNFEFEIKDEKSFEEYIKAKIDINELKNFFKNNFFYKQRKIEFLFYQECIKHYSNKGKKFKDSYPWNLDFIDNNGFQIDEKYYYFSKITD